MKSHENMQDRFGNNGNQNNNQRKQKDNKSNNQQAQLPRYDLEKICKENEVPVNKNLLKFDFVAKFFFAAVVLPYLLGWIDFTYEAWEIVLVTIAFFFMVGINSIIALITNMEFKE